MNQKLKIVKNRDLLKNYLKNKRVVVVGPAPSIVNSKQMELIDSYDVVVRLNRAVPIPETMKLDIGTRTDILYNCMNPSNECGGKIDIPTLRQNGVKFLVSPYAPFPTNDRRFQRFKTDIENFLKNNSQDDLQFSHFDTKYFSKLLKMMKLPNTGINAILDLLTFEIQELYITGFTFFKGGYYPAYRNYNEEEVMARMERHKLHNQEKQFAYMKKILLGDKRVKMDVELSKIVNSDNIKFLKTQIDLHKPLNKLNSVVSKTKIYSNVKKIKTHPNGKPMDKPNGKPMDKPSGKPMDKPSGKPMDKPNGKPMDNNKKINPPKNTGHKIKIGTKNYLVKNKGNIT